MKLGATITSERGKPITKTGNENLEIKISGENKETLLEIRIIPSNFGYEMKGWTNENKFFSFFLKETGSLKQGKREEKCHCGYPCIHGTYYCERHQLP